MSCKNHLSIWLFGIGLFALLASGCDNSGGDEKGTAPTGNAMSVNNMPQTWVGTDCYMDDTKACKEHDADAFCLSVSSNNGICTKVCSLPVIEADTDSEGEPAAVVPVETGCPDGRVGCVDWSFYWDPGRFEELGSSTLCTELCVPEPTEDTCMSAHLACEPLRAWDFNYQSAVCVQTNCNSFAAGPNLQLKADPAAGCMEESECEPDETCYLGACNPKFGCHPATGRYTISVPARADIGDPCQVNRDCGGNMICDTTWPNGYCTRFGCNAAYESSLAGSEDNMAEYGCGDGGVCMNGAQPLSDDPYLAGIQGGMCMKACSQTAGADDPDGCRQTSWDSPVLDANGDYDCYDLGEYSLSVVRDKQFIRAAFKMFEKPACVSPFYIGGECPTNRGEETYDSVRCDEDFNANDGGQSMMCRDPQGNQNDQAGRCLDETTSGSTGHWN